MPQQLLHWRQACGCSTEHCIYHDRESCHITEILDKRAARSCVVPEYVDLRSNTWSSLSSSRNVLERKTGRKWIVETDNDTQEQDCSQRLLTIISPPKKDLKLSNCNFEPCDWRSRAVYHSLIDPIPFRIVSTSSTGLFGALSAELRHEIYGYVLIREEPIICNGESENKKRHFARYGRKKIVLDSSNEKEEVSSKEKSRDASYAKKHHVALLQTCRLIHEEASKILYGENKLIFADVNKEPSKYPHSSYFDRFPIAKGYIPYLKDVTIEIGGMDWDLKRSEKVACFTTAILRRATLESLTIKLGLYWSGFDELLDKNKGKPDQKRKEQIMEGLKCGEFERGHPMIKAIIAAISSPNLANLTIRTFTQLAFAPGVGRLLRAVIAANPSGPKVMVYKSHYATQTIDPSRLELNPMESYYCMAYKRRLMHNYKEGPISHRWAYEPEPKETCQEHQLRESLFSDAAMRDWSRSTKDIQNSFRAIKVPLPDVNGRPGTGARYKSCVYVRPKVERVPDHSPSQRKEVRCSKKCPGYLDSAHFWDIDYEDCKHKQMLITKYFKPISDEEYYYGPQCRMQPYWDLA